MGLSDVTGGVRCGAGEATATLKPDQAQVTAGVSSEGKTPREAAEANAKVIVASHLGRPEGKPTEEYSLAPVARRLAYRLHKKVTLAPDCVGPAVDKIKKGRASEAFCLFCSRRQHFSPRFLPF